MRTHGITLSFALFVTSCGSTPAPTLDSVLRQAHGEQLRAGVSSVDVTPPPGLALYGHGPEGRVSTGTRLRLRCEPFVFTQGDESVAIVPCDLWAISTELRFAVTDRVRHAGLPLGADRILLMGTHTHGGPAHYFGPEMYSGTYASRWPGFDQDVLDFLAERIASAIVTAYRARQPVHVAWGQRAVYGLSRNRSFGAFASNFACTSSDPNRPCTPMPAVLTGLFGGELIEHVPRRSRGTSTCTVNGGAACLDIDGRPASALPPAERAIDPTLSVLRVDTATGRTLGVLSVFGMHPTGIANTNTLYHGDVFGFATRTAARLIGCFDDAHGDANDPLTDTERARCMEEQSNLPRARRVIVGLANGAEGDVSPRWDFQAARESRRIGEALGAQIADLYESLDGRLSAAGPDAIERVYYEAPLPGAALDSQRRLCNRPSVGTAFVGGAEDGPTRFRVMPQFNEGRRSRDPVTACEVPPLGSEDDSDVCHGPKLRLMPFARDFTADGSDFPIVAPLALVRIADGAFAMTPAELTTTVGMRIRDAITAALASGNGPAVTSVAVVGLTNSYLQYVATPCEYNLQDYEGASTLYGPHSAEFFQRQFTCLAQRLRGGGNAFCGAGTPTAIIDRAQSPRSLERLPEDPLEIEAPVNVGPLEPERVNREGAVGWQLQWEGVPPEYARARDRQFIEIVRVSDGAVVDDDDGSSMTIEHRRGLTWRALWIPSLSPDSELCEHAPGQPTQLRFHIRGAVVLTSRPFELVCAPASQAREGGLAE